MTTSKRVSGWKVAGIILGIAALSLAVVIVSVWLGVNRRFDLVQQRVEELIPPPDSRISTRPVLFGRPVPGDAAQDYAAAESEARASSFYHDLRFGLPT